MAFLVEKGYGAVHSESYRIARHVLTQKLEIPNNSLKTVSIGRPTRIKGTADRDLPKEANGDHCQLWRKGGWGIALWHGTSLRASVSRKLLSTSKYLFSCIRYSVRDLPWVPFTRGEILPIIPQTRADLEIARRDLQNCLKDGV